jgi:hypothetical protein
MLLLDLEDVYWAKDGRTSVDTAVGLIGIGGIYLAAAPFWHDAVGELLHTTAYLSANRATVSHRETPINALARPSATTHRPSRAVFLIAAKCG